MSLRCSSIPTIPIIPYHSIPYYIMPYHSTSMVWYSATHTSTFPLSPLHSLFRDPQLNLNRPLSPFHSDKETWNWFAFKNMKSLYYNILTSSAFWDWGVSIFTQHKLQNQFYTSSIWYKKGLILLSVRKKAILWKQVKMKLVKKKNLAKSLKIFCRWAAWGRNIEWLCRNTNCQDMMNNMLWDFKI